MSSKSFLCCKNSAKASTYKEVSEKFIRPIKVIKNAKRQTYPTDFRKIATIDTITQAAIETSKNEINCGTKNYILQANMIGTRKQIYSMRGYRDCI